MPIQRARRFALGVCIAVTPAFSGCNDLVVENLVAGVRDGASTAATGIINGFFERRFNLGASQDASTNTQEHGDDLFVRS